MENFVPFFFFILLLLASFRWMPIFKRSGLSNFEIGFFFGIKIVFGILLITVYSKYYPQRNLADVFKYFDDAEIIYSNATMLHFSLLETFNALATHTNAGLLAHTQHFDKQGSGIFEANHHLIIYIHLFLRYFSNGSIYFHSLCFSFCSLLGSMYIYTALKKHFYASSFALKMAVFGLPSVLFWSSGMLKETLILFAVGLLGYGYSFRKHLSDIQSIAMLMSGLMLILFIKPYVLIGVLLSAFVYWILKQENNKSLLLSSIVIVLVALFFRGNDWANLLLHKRNDFVTLSEHMHTQSLLHQEHIPENGLLELIQITPSALFAVCFEPTLFHLKSFKDIPFCLENCVLFIVIAFLILRYSDFNKNKWPLSGALVMFVLSQFLIIGLTVPVSGAIIRYKVTALPFLLIIILLNINLRLFKYDIYSKLGLKKEEN